MLCVCEQVVCESVCELRGEWTADCVKEVRIRELPMSPSATPATQKTAASRAGRDQARRHSQPSAISAACHTK